MSFKNGQIVPSLDSYLILAIGEDTYPAHLSSRSQALVPGRKEQPGRIA
jgi:hypothetical protein